MRQDTQAKIIRFANKFDIQDIVKLIKEFAETSTTAQKAGVMNWSKTYVEKLLNEIIAGRGFILIDNNKTGILIAVKSSIYWIENAIQLQEIMLHSKNKTTMIRLVKKYIEIAKKMICKNEITNAVMFSKPDVKYEKLGLNKFELAWEV